MNAAAERVLMRAESHGNKPGYVVDRAHPEVRMLLGEFSRLNGHEQAEVPAGISPDEARSKLTTAESNLGDGVQATAVAVGGAPSGPRKRTRRGSRGGRNRRGGRGRKKPASSSTGGGSEAAD